MHRGRDTRVDRKSALARSCCLRRSAIGQLLQSREKHAVDVASSKRTHAAKVELALEHRNLARGRGARVLEHDTETARYLVELGNGKQLRVRRQCVQLAG